MKIYHKIGFFAVAASVFASCAINDPYKDIMEVGQAAPTVSWELGSLVATAGDSISFKGKYYTDEEHTPDRAEVWATLIRTETQAATLKLSTGLAYTLTLTNTDTVRTSQPVATFSHSLAQWNGHEFELTAKFPISQTLGKLTWARIKEWDQKRFDSYYPADFQKQFTDKVIDYLTADSLYIKDLQYIYVNYEFTADQFAQVNGQHAGAVIPTETATDEKSKLWYTNTEKVVGRYYKDAVDGKTIIHEVDLNFSDPTKKLYDVYESSPWLFCRYDDDAGAVLTSVRAAYMPTFKDLISLIPFQDWIYNSSDKVYEVSFVRSFSMGTVFKVYDTEGNVGYTTDVKEISIN